MLVDLYWHHWELEPPLARETSLLIVSTGHQFLEQKGSVESEQTLTGADQPSALDARRSPAAPKTSAAAAIADAARPATSDMTSASPVSQPVQPAT